MPPGVAVSHCIFWDQIQPVLGTCYARYPTDASEGGGGLILSDSISPVVWPFPKFLGCAKVLLTTSETPAPLSSHPPRISRVICGVLRALRPALPI